MPRTLIPSTVIDHNGAVLNINVDADVANGNYFINTGYEYLLVQNLGTYPLTVTVDYAADSYGRDGSKIHAVNPGQIKIIGPFLTELYNQNGNQVFVNASAACKMLVIARP